MKFLHALLLIPALFPFLQLSMAGSLDRIAFGSCNRESLPQPLWKPIADFHPKLWIWLGDNIYGDTDDMALLAAKWKTQKDHPGYAALRRSCEVVGTWDDHDYGVNDGGKEFPAKAGSAALFLDFLDVPADAPRRAREGVYDARTFGEPGRQVMVILLDVRTHRDKKQSGGDILGRAQWEWLEETLAASQANVHIFCSGSQILSGEHRHEKWVDYPDARARLLGLAARLPGVIFLSGDRHFGELSRLESPPVLEATSSGLTHFWKDFPGEPNAHRVGEIFAALNFGTLEIDWPKRSCTLSLRDENGVAVRCASAGF